MNENIRKKRREETIWDWLSSNNSRGKRTGVNSKGAETTRTKGGTEKGMGYGSRVHLIDIGH